MSTIAMNHGIYYCVN